MGEIGSHFKIDKSLLISNPKAVYQGQKYRITILSEMLVRLEYDDAGVFMDDATMFAINRKFNVPEFNVQEDEKFLIISTKYFRLQYLKGKPYYGSSFAPDSNLRVTLLDTDKYWYFGHDEARNFGCVNYNIDTKNLYISPAEVILEGKQEKKKKGKTKTISAKELFSKQKGLYSTDGFVAIDDSKTPIIDSNGYVIKNDRAKIDTYLFMYKRDFALCLKDYFHLTGPAPLIPRYALGIWWYKDEAYNLFDIKDLVFDFSRNKIPLSVLLLGSNWHTKDKNDLKRFKSGFTFNHDKFPKPALLTTYLHDRGIRLGINIDPSEGINPHEFKFSDFAHDLGINDNQVIPFNAFDKNFMASYFTNLINPLYNDGVDFFWLDYYTKDGDSLSALDYYHFNDYKKFDNYRGLIMSRLSKYAPHRYPIHYSGETLVSWDTLNKLPYYTSLGSNLGLSWWSHDIGGFKDGVEDSELYVRYVQLGCYSPIFRFAASYGHYYKREPWRWDVKTFDIVRDYCQLRSRLVSYIYGEAYKYHKIGIPLVQPLYYSVPEIYDEIDYRNEYYFGSELLVAPITKQKDNVMQRAVERIFLPEGVWYDFKTGKKFMGNKRYVTFFKDEDYPVFAKSGSIVCLADLDDNINLTTPPKTLEVHVFPGKNNIYNLYEDDGVSSLYEQGYYIVTRFDYNYLANNYTLIIRPFEGKSGIIPDKRNYRIKFRNTRNADDVKVMIEANSVEFTSYVDDNDFVVEVNDVPTIKQLTIICKGSDIEIEAARIINEDIDSIISDLPISTKLKESVAKVMFSDDDISNKRIGIKKLKKKGLDALFIRMFLKLLDYTKNI